MKFSISALVLALLCLTGCRTDKNPPAGDDTGDTSPIALDGDGDGYASDVDCDDDNAFINPGRDELCSTDFDDDCDGQINEGDAADALDWYIDGDGDGYGSDTAPIQACEAPSGAADNNQDCDDLDIAIHPGADEICDERDNDCDGGVDDDAVDADRWYLDGDGDGYGDPAASALSCTSISGYVPDPDDCDDRSASSYPGAPEYCDGVDNNCDGSVDEDSATDATLWYLDSDADGFGDALSTTYSCTQPSGYVGDATDCEDSDGAINPDAPEVCDDQDNNCDGAVDEDSAVDATTWYLDADSDGYGVSSSALTQCDQPSGYVSADGDCRPSDADDFPGADEYCDGVDNDCDGSTDESDALDASTWYLDSDSDGYGDASSSQASCDQPTGYVSDDTDCDDSDSGTYPSAAEYCDKTDNDCDGSTDESDAVDAKTWYADSDKDGYGDASSSQASCTSPSGYTSDDSDCDDSDSSINPAATEICDGSDNDCDGTVDGASAIDASTWYIDADGDGDGDSSTSSTACTAPSGYVSNADDCDDSDATLNSSTVWYYDYDRDGYGVSTTTLTQCRDPGTYYVQDSGDCGPYDSSSYPGATEVCVSGTSAEGVDNDCDGTIDEDCPEIHCGTISADETWAAADDHLVTCNVYVQGSSGPILEIEDGATVEFSNATGLWVGWSSYGSLDVSGTASKGVLFTSSNSSPSAGDWYGLILGTRSDTTLLEYLDIEYGGYSSSYPGALYISGGEPEISSVGVYESGTHGVYVTGTSTAPYIHDSTFQDNVQSGMYVYSSSGLDTSLTPGFTDNTLTGNGEYPVVLPAAFAGELDASSTYTGNSDDRIRLLADTLDSDADWQALDADYLIAGNVYVQGSLGPVLTIEDGTTVDFALSTGLWVGYSNVGELSINGSTSGVTFTSGRSSPRAGDWYGLILGTNDSDSNLSGLTVEYGGYSASWPGGISVYSDAVLEDVTVTDSDYHGLYVYNAEPTLDELTLQDNDSYGLYLASSAGLGGLLTYADISGNGDAPAILPGNYVGYLDSTGAYTGNGSDVIEVSADTIDTDATWQLLDVDYQVQGNLYVQGSSAPTLSIEDEVTVEFIARTGLWVGQSNSGALDLQGDSSSGNGITFTSALSSPAAGDWYGLIFGSYTRAAATNLDGFTVEYGGYSTSYRGNVYIYSSDLTLSDCAITDGALEGIYALYSELDISDCDISDNGDSGVVLGSGSSLGASLTDSTLTGNGEYPIELSANSLGMLDSSSSYSGNGSDYVYTTGGTVSDDATWQALDVDYYVASDITIQGTGAPHVDTTGTTFYMASGRTLYVGTSYSGSLDADSATFTSALSSPAAGDWRGIYLYGNSVDSLTALTNSTVEYAGSTYGLVFVYNADPTLTGNTFADSSTYGVYALGSVAGTNISGNTYSSCASGNTYGL